MAAYGIALVVDNTGGQTATRLKTALENFGHTVTLVDDSVIGSTDFSSFDLIVTARITVGGATLRATEKPLIVGLYHPSGSDGNITGISTSLPTQMNLVGNTRQSDNSESSFYIDIDDIDHFIGSGFRSESTHVRWRVGSATYAHSVDSGEPYIGDLIAVGSRSHGTFISGLPTQIAIEGGTLDLLGSAIPARYVVSNALEPFGTSSDLTVEGKLLLGLSVNWVMGDDSPPDDSCGMLIWDAFDRVDGLDAWPYYGPEWADENWWKDLSVEEFSPSSETPIQLAGGSGNAGPENEPQPSGGIIHAPFRGVVTIDNPVAVRKSLVAMMFADSDSSNAIWSILHYDIATQSGISIENQWPDSGSPGGIEIIQWENGEGTSLHSDPFSVSNEGVSNTLLKLILKPDGTFRAINKNGITTQTARHDITLNLGAQLARSIGMGFRVISSGYQGAGVAVWQFSACTSDILTVTGLNDGERFGLYGGDWGITEIISDPAAGGIATIEGGLLSWPADRLRILENDGVTPISTFNRGGFPKEYLFWGGQTWNRTGSLEPCPTGGSGVLFPPPPRGCIDPLVLVNPWEVETTPDGDWTPDAEPSGSWSKQ